ERQRDRLRAERHDGRRVRDQEPQRQVQLRLRPVPPLLSRLPVRVRVHLFARYREVTGKERVDLELPEGGTVETAWSAVVDRHPQVAQYRPFTLFAVGHDYVEPDHHLKADDELSLFPPVSGGAPTETDVYAVVEHPLSPDDIAARVDDPGAGGIVIFS